MPTNARLLIRLGDYPNEEFLSKLRTDFKDEMNLSDEDFYSGGPFVVISNKERRYMPITDEGSVWLDVNIWRSYFGEGYSRGDGEFFIRCANWLETRVPGCEIYYGHDVDDENISLFDQRARDRLRKLMLGKDSSL